MNRGKRIFLLLAYASISFVVGFFFFQSGKGPYQPFSIMESWGMVVPLLLKSLQNDNVGSLLIGASFLAYPLAILLHNNIFRRFVHTPIPIPTLAIHSVGSLISLVLAGNQPTYYFSRSVNLLAWIVPIIIVFTYLTLDWRLARGINKSEPAEADN